MSGRELNQFSKLNGSLGHFIYEVSFDSVWSTSPRHSYLNNIRYGNGSKVCWERLAKHKTEAHLHFLELPSVREDWHIQPN
jgi:hypothetical protein